MFSSLTLWDSCVPDFLRRLWASPIWLSLPKTVDQVVIDIISPRVHSMEAPSLRLWKPCPSPAALAADDVCEWPDEGREQRYCSSSAAANHYSICSVTDFRESTSERCSNGSVSSSCTDSLDSPRCCSSDAGSESSTGEGGRAPESWEAAESPTLSAEHAPLLIPGAENKASIDAPRARVPQESYQTPPRASRVRPFANGFSELCGGLPSQSPCWSPPSSSEAVRPASGPKNNSNTRSSGSGWVPSADIDRLLASVIVGSLWQDEE